MSKVFFVFLVVLSVFALQSQSLTVLNNVTFSSDILQELFLKEVRFDFNISDIVGVDVLKARKCILQLRAISNQFPSYKTARFVDSWGKFPSGLLYGHLTDLGNYDQCVRTSVTLDESSGITNGQYCFASIPLGGASQKVYSDKELSLLNETPLDTRAVPGFAKIKLGVCVPEVCEAKLVTTVFQRATSKFLNGILSGVEVSSCKVAQKDPFSGVDIFAIVLFSLFGVMMVLSSLYDYYTVCFDKKPVPLLLAFSVITNGRKLFAINTKKSPNNIDCLTGIRVFSMAWVLQCHNYMFIFNTNLTNYVDLIGWYKKPSSMIILMGTVSVDSFFFLSGLLVAWIGLRELDRTKGKLNVIMMWVHRYIRLTPALAAGVLFLVTLNKYVGSGPMRDSSIAMHSTCEDTWWSTLLYVQNYVNPSKICFMQSWYLAIDTQLYILSPLVLIPLWKWGKKFIPALVILSLLSVACIIATFYVEEFTSLIGFSEAERPSTIYFPTHTRYSVWLVGIVLGYIMHTNKTKDMRPSKIIQLLGWIVCFGTILAIIFAPYFTLQSSHSATVGQAAAYEALKRIAWGVALAWIVFASYFGFGGLVNSFLSHPFWQPLGRLTYCLYLVHIAVQAINFGITRTDVFFSDYGLILYFWSNFGMSLMAAIAFSLAFEAPHCGAMIFATKKLKTGHCAPVLVIEKVIFGQAKPKPAEKVVPVIVPNVVPTDTPTLIEPSAPLEASVDVTTSKEV